MATPFDNGRFEQNGLCLREQQRDVMHLGSSVLQYYTTAPLGVLHPVVLGGSR